MRACASYKRNTTNKPKSDFASFDRVFRILFRKRPSLSFFVQSMEATILELFFVSRVPQLWRAVFHLLLSQLDDFLQPQIVSETRRTLKKQTNKKKAIRRRRRKIILPPLQKGRLGSPFVVSVLEVFSSSAVVGTPASFNCFYLRAEFPFQCLFFSFLFRLFFGLSLLSS